MDLAMMIDWWSRRRRLLDDACRAFRASGDARSARAIASIDAHVFVSSNARARASGRRDVDARARWRR
jgi:hypothetical protein